MDLKNQETGQGAWLRGNPLPPSLGVIEVIHVAPRGTQESRRRVVLTVALGGSGMGKQPSEKKLKYTREPITFNDDDALVVTARINGFIIKRVLID